jgi:hypothetical protein
MSMPAELVDVVIGVDTHKHAHSAAVIVALTGAAAEDLTVDTDPDGYAAQSISPIATLGCVRGRSRAPVAN